MIVGRYEVLLEQREHARLADAGRQVHAEAQADLLEHLLPRQRGVRDQRDGDLLAPLEQRVLHRGGLAGADLAGDEHEGLSVLDAEPQVRARLLMLTAGVEEPQRMTGGEGILAQPEMTLVHRTVRGRGDSGVGRCGSAHVVAGQLDVAGARARRPRREVHFAGSSSSLMLYSVVYV